MYLCIIGLKKKQIIIQKMRHIIAYKCVVSKFKIARTFQNETLHSKLVILASK